MLNAMHIQLWATIDRLAAHYNLSVSGLARKAGLDPTIFNRSKRIRSDGKLHWPSTESVARIIDATGISPEQAFGFFCGVDVHDLIERCAVKRSLDQLRPNRQWLVDITVLSPHHLCIVEVTDDALSPFYCRGDSLLCTLTDQIDNGQTVLLQNRAGRFQTGRLKEQSTRTVTLWTAERGGTFEQLQTSEIAWMIRILWVRPALPRHQAGGETS